MHVEIFGPDDGTPIVFLHGSMVAGWMWMGQVEDLPEYRCFLPDLPGIGNSATTPWLSLSDTSDKIANMISTQCPGGRAHIVGLSLGGITALHVAAKHPEVVESLIVSGVPYGKINLLLRLFSSVMLKLYNRPWGARAIASLFGIPHDESMDAFMKTALQTAPISLQNLDKELFQTPLPNNLDQVTAPTLAVVGEKDTVLAKRAVRYLQDVMPNAVGYSVPQVGHQWNAENRELFSEMVRLWVDSKSIPKQLLHI